MGLGVVWLQVSRFNGTGVFVWLSLIPRYEGLMRPWMRMGNVVWLHVSRSNGTGIFVSRLSSSVLVFGMRMGPGVVWLQVSRYNGTGVFVAAVASSFFHCSLVALSLCVCPTFPRVGIASDGVRTA